MKKLILLIALIFGIATSSVWAMDDNEEYVFETPYAIILGNNFYRQGVRIQKVVDEESNREIRPGDKAWEMIQEHLRLSHWNSNIHYSGTFSFYDSGVITSYDISYAKIKNSIEQFRELGYTNYQIPEESAWRSMREEDAKNRGSGAAQKSVAQQSNKSSPTAASLATTSNEKKSEKKSFFQNLKEKFSSKGKSKNDDKLGKQSQKNNAAHNNPDGTSTSSANPNDPKNKPSFLMQHWKPIAAITGAGIVIIAGILAKVIKERKKKREWQQRLVSQENAGAEEE